MDADELTGLVTRARAGDPAAYDQVVRRFQDLAVGYSYTLLGDFHLAQDAAQEAFLDAYVNLPKLREPRAFAAWFRRVVLKQCDRLVRGKHLATVSLEEAAEVACRGPDPAQVVETVEMQEIVRFAIRALPEAERAVTVLFYMSEYSHQEISEFLGIPVTTVKSRLHSARNRLRDRMVELLDNSLREQRPSRDESFAARVAEILRAARAGDRRRVQELLDEDTALLGPHEEDARGHGDITPLHYAAQAGHIPVARMLLDRGADLEAVDASHRLTPLGWAAVFPDPKKEMAEFLLSRGARVDLFSAVALGMKEAVEAMLAEDPDLIGTRLTPGDWSMQPLHLAAWRGHKEVVECLLDHGADLDGVDDLGRTPLAYAEWGGHREVAALLRQRTGQDA
jgi:RNA polymerase sigma factor (sigma-70 family)